MKKGFGIVLCVLLVSLFAFALADVEINEKNFPDEEFRNQVILYKDRNRDGWLSEQEINDTVSFSLRELNLTSLKGIEFFTALKELDCYKNQLTELDVSSNTALTRLNCGGNRLTSLKLGQNAVLTRLDCYNNQLTTLDLSGLSALFYLNCDRNKLTALDVSGNTELSYLLCAVNCLTTLDTSRNIALHELEIGNNQLASLDVSRNTELSTLNCSYNQLTELDVSHQPNLQNLACSNNQLTVLNVKANTRLLTLWCSDNSLSSLDVSHCTTLHSMGCERNHLTKLKLGANEKMVLVRCFSNKLSVLDIRQCPELMSIVEGVEPYDFTTDGKTYFGWCRMTSEGWASIYLSVDKGLKVLTGDEVLVTSIKLNLTKKTLTRTVSQKKPTLQLKATVKPENATDSSVEWTSSDPKIAKVDQNGMVTALKKGTCVITCTAKDGSGVKATSKITVKDQLVTKLTLNRKTLSLKKGKTFQLKVTIKPEGAMNKKVRWTSSDKKVATVDKNGKIRAVGKGTCVITCEALDGSGKKASCKITVK